MIDSSQDIPIDTAAQVQSSLAQFYPDTTRIHNPGFHAIEADFTMIPVP
jgi:hypothetical protein